MKGNQKKCHSKLDLESHHKLLRNDEILNQVQDDEGRSGFTLIELLVVVLIIGILAAIALPQYQKAVIRSRNTQIKQLVRVVVEAEKAYYLEHGKYAANFKDLDIDIPLTPVKTSAGGETGVCANGVQGTDSSRSSNDFYIVLNNNENSNMTWVGVVGYWSKGRYKCSGFGMGLVGPQQEPLLCREHRSNRYYTAGEGAFCEKIEHASWQGQNSWWRWYKLP